jgi:hypothetical protein
MLDLWPRKGAGRLRRGGLAAARSACRWSTRAGVRGGVFRATSECEAWMRARKGAGWLARLKDQMATRGGGVNRSR